jgi:phage anti-repressor protein
MDLSTSQAEGFAAVTDFHLGNLRTTRQNFSVTLDFAKAAHSWDRRGVH